MEVELRFFGSIAQTVGENNGSIKCSEHTTLAEALKMIFKKYEFGTISASGEISSGYMRIYVNGRNVPGHTELRDGDQIMFLSPVAGGS